MKLLDLFCKAGGAGEGYRRAGFDVTGVDIEPQPNNPHRFIQSDALEFLADHGEEFDAIHGSPPCQGYSNLKAMWADRSYPMLIGPLRELLKLIGKPLFNSFGKIVLLSLILSSCSTPATDNPGLSLPPMRYSEMPTNQVTK